MAKTFLVKFNAKVLINGQIQVDTFVGTGNLEVHVAVEVFQTLNIDHGHPAFAFGDQTAGDTGNGSLDRHTGVHQSQGRAAYGSLRGGTVGRDNFGYAADGVGEFFHGGQYGNQRTFCQCAMTDFATTRTTHRARFPYTVWREVVVMNITFAAFVVQTIQNLFFTSCTQCNGGQNLCLTTSKQRTAVWTRQNIYFAGDWTYFCHSTTVRTDFVYGNQTTYNIFHQCIQCCTQIIFLFRELF